MVDDIGNFDHDRIVTDWSLDYLREKGSGKKKEPWALYVGLLMPHWPFCPPHRHYNMYYPDKLDMPIDGRFPNPDLHPVIQFQQNGQALGEVTEDILRGILDPEMTDRRAKIDLGLIGPDGEDYTLTKSVNDYK